MFKFDVHKDKRVVEWDGEVDVSKMTRTFELI